MKRRYSKKGGNAQPEPFKEIKDPVCDGVNGAQACAVAKVQQQNEEQTDMIAQSGGNTISGGNTVTVPSFEGPQNGDGAYTATQASAQSNETMMQSEENSKLDKVEESKSPDQQGGSKKRTFIKKTLKKRNFKKRKTTKKYKLKSKKKLVLKNLSKKHNKKK